MKKLARFTCSYSFSLLEIFISLLSSQTNIKIDKNNVQSYLNPDCDSVFNYIDNNFLYFVNEYNKTVTDDSYFNASYVENHFDILVNVDGDNQKGIFIDFDKDNGYALLIDNYEFLDFKIVGKSPYYDIDLNCKHVYTNNNYHYINNKNEAVPTSEDIISDNLINQTYRNKIYDGQTHSGSSTITDLDKYVYDYYGDGWSLCKSFENTRKNILNQSDLSCYLQHNNEGLTSSEGNCWLVSAYNILQQFQYKNKDLPKYFETIYYNPKVEETETYHKYFDKNDNNISDKLDNGIFEYELNPNTAFPILYTKIRKYALNDKKLNIESGQTAFKTCNLVQEVASLYDMLIMANTHFNWKLYIYPLIKNLDDGYPLLWPTSTDTYGAHTMIVVGYSKYEKRERTFLWFYKTRHKIFYQIIDGWNREPVYYDMNRHIGPSIIGEFSYKKWYWWLTWAW